MILGYILAKVYISNWFSKFIKWIGIRHTVNPYLWSDISDAANGTWVYIEFKDDDCAYLGALDVYEEFQRYPLIALERYDIRTLSTGAINHDHMKDPRRRILLDTSKASMIRLIYDENSPKTLETKKAIEKSPHDDTEQP